MHSTDMGTLLIKLGLYITFLVPVLILLFFLMVAVIAVIPTGVWVVLAIFAAYVFICCILPSKGK